jgi:hypothetical protein
MAVKSSHMTVGDHVMHLYQISRTPPSYGKEWNAMHEQSIYLYTAVLAPIDYSS